LSSVIFDLIVIGKWTERVSDFSDHYSQFNRFQQGRPVRALCDA